MKKLRLNLFLALVVFASSAHAYTSIATIKNEVKKSWFSSSNYLSQKEADTDSLEGCRVTARQKGIGELAKQCTVVTRGAGPGYGAVTCGEQGCSWSMGHQTVQEAVDAAYQLCSQSYSKCQDSGIQSWEDFKGYPAKATAQKPPVATADCRPRTGHLECTSSCKNGSCVVTYKNSCQIHVQVQPQFNPLTSSWDYPAPAC